MWPSRAERCRHVSEGVASVSAGWSMQVGPGHVMPCVSAAEGRKVQLRKPRSHVCYRPSPEGGATFSSRQQAQLFREESLPPVKATGAGAKPASIFTDNMDGASGVIALSETS